MNSSPAFASSPVSPSAPVRLAPSTGIIAVNAAADLERSACGRIVFWTLEGDIAIDALTRALTAAGSAAIAPKGPSALVGLHRAVDVVAKMLGKLEVHHHGRGTWAIVNAPQEETTTSGAPVLVYPIACHAKVTRDKSGVETLTIQGQGEEQIRTAYEVARTMVSTSDIGNWLCDKLTALKGIPLRERGGVYFLPQTSVDRWMKIVAALGACSQHKLNAVPAMRSADAIDAILSALTTDTQNGCDKIADDIAKGVGSEALASRDETSAGRLKLLEEYEDLLGVKLDGLRSAIDKTRAAIAVAMMAESGGAE